ncbi:NAD-dependent epimerase/dehydratase family protein, partial [Sanguibacter sp. 25GB23B1]|uniref:NAD-dependent epimerase/dehydratase family protein n=1 Tax=Sanguibacter sp. 25GB23B1 TaxID=3156067 RepID=UPI0032AECCDF
MTTTLVLGGTAWLGREIAARLLAQGDRVTCLARGESGTVPDGATLVRGDRSRPGAYDEVARTDWDAVVDVSRDPSTVTGAVAALGPRAAHWTFVSTTSVYAHDDDPPGADESAETVEPTDVGDYAHAKVAAERAARTALGDRLLVARLGLVAGPGDPSDRFGYWVSRLALADDGPVLVPVAEERHVQVVDVRDAAQWVAGAARRGTTGTVNVVGHPVPLGDLLAEAAAVAGFHGELVTAEDDRLAANGVQHWAGPRSLPLWLPASCTGFFRRGNDAFLAAGGTLRPVHDTLTGTLEDERGP